MHNVGGKAFKLPPRSALWIFFSRVNKRRRRNNKKMAINYAWKMPASQWMKKKIWDGKHYSSLFRDPFEISPLALLFPSCWESRSECERNKRKGRLGVYSFSFSFFCYASVKRTDPRLLKIAFSSLSSLAVFSMQLSLVNSFIARSFDAHDAPKALRENLYSFLKRKARDTILCLKYSS